VIDNICRSRENALAEDIELPTMNVNLTREMTEFVASELASGDYASASELVRDALRSLRRDREFENQKLEILRRKLDLGIAQAERGEFSSRRVMDIAAAVLAEEDE
jgi:antitoxin ParD1/3/4